jgi:hypothetical protein
VSVVFSFVERKALVIFHNLPLMDERSLLIPKIDLKVSPVRAVDNRLDGSINDFATVHGDSDGVAYVELPWGWVGLFRYSGIVR